jgi:3-methylcrotonyl-CoA carboxylase alpha subunit
MEEAGVPLVPGYHGDAQDDALLRAAADDIGYPVLLKATAGGGGKGMRRVDSADEFDEALAAARREATRPSATSHMLVEKYLVRRGMSNPGVLRQPRQRRLPVRARLLGAAPPPESDGGSAGAGHDAGAAPRDGRDGGAAAAAIGYRGAGTVEFLLEQDGSSTSWK